MIYMMLCHQNSLDMVTTVVGHVTGNECDGDENVLCGEFGAALDIFQITRSHGASRTLPDTPTHRHDVFAERSPARWPILLKVCWTLFSPFQGASQGC